MSSPERSNNPLSADGAVRLREDLAKRATHREAMPADSDASIRSAIRDHFARASTQSSRALPGRGVRWTSLVRFGAIAAALALVALLAFRASMSGPSPDRRLIELAKLVDAAPERAAVLSDPRLRAILAAIVAMPGPLPHPEAGEGRFAVYDILVDDVGVLPLSWLIELAMDGELVGIEGGDAPFEVPAAYDPAALHGGAVRLANVAAAGRSDGRSLRLGSIVVRHDLAAEGPRIVERSFIGPGGETLALSVRCVLRAVNGSDR